MSENKQSRAAIIEQKIQEVLQSNLFDNIFASVALEDEDACQYVLQKITGNTDLDVTYAKGQYRLQNLTAKDSILDIYAEDSHGSMYNVELQKDGTVDHPHRTRCYGSALDKTSLDKGDKYNEMPDVHVIYVSETDVMNTGETVCPVEKTLGKNKSTYSDGRNITYVNAGVDDGSDVAELMKYFKTADPNDMRFGALSERVRFLKTKKGGYEEMNDFVETMMQFGREDGIQEGMELNSKKTAKRLFAKHNSVEDIADTLEVDVEVVEDWLGLARA